MMVGFCALICLEGMGPAADAGPGFLLAMQARLQMQPCQEMQERNMFLSEGLCGLVLSRCGEARHIQLAEAPEHEPHG